MGVEREVVGGERDVGGEQRLESPLQLTVDDAGVVVPEEPVVDDQQLGTGVPRTLEELS